MEYAVDQGLTIMYLFADALLDGILDIWIFSSEGVLVIDIATGPWFCSVSGIVIFTIPDNPNSSSLLQNAKRDILIQNQRLYHLIIYQSLNHVASIW